MQRGVAAVAAVVVVALGLCVWPAEATTCAPGRTGSRCNECLPGYFGSHCLPCVCNHGTCNDGVSGNGVCVCESAWTGATCSNCTANHYGSTCAPCMCVHGTCSDGYLGSGACTCNAPYLPPYCEPAPGPTSVDDLTVSVVGVLPSLLLSGVGGPRVPQKVQLYSDAITHAQAGSARVAIGLNVTAMLPDNCFFVVSDSATYNTTGITNPLDYCSVPSQTNEVYHVMSIAPPVFDSAKRSLVAPNNFPYIADPLILAATVAQVVYTVTSVPNGQQVFLTFNATVADYELAHCETNAMMPNSNYPWAPEAVLDTFRCNYVADRRPASWTAPFAVIAYTGTQEQIAAAERSVTGVAEGLVAHDVSRVLPLYKGDPNWLTYGSSWARYNDTIRAYSFLVSDTSIQVDVAYDIGFDLQAYTNDLGFDPSTLVAYDVWFALCTFIYPSNNVVYARARKYLRGGAVSAVDGVPPVDFTLVYEGGFAWSHTAGTADIYDYADLYNMASAGATLDLGGTFVFNTAVDYALAQEEVRLPDGRPAFPSPIEPGNLLWPRLASRVGTYADIPMLYSDEQKVRGPVINFDIITALFQSDVPDLFGPVCSNAFPALDNGDGLYWNTLLADASAATGQPTVTATLDTRRLLQSTYFMDALSAGNQSSLACFMITYPLSPLDTTANGLPSPYGLPLALRPFIVETLGTALPAMRPSPARVTAMEPSIYTNDAFGHPLVPHWNRTDHTVKNMWVSLTVSGVPEDTGPYDCTETVNNMYAGLRAHRAVMEDICGRATGAVAVNVCATLMGGYSTGAFNGDVLFPPGAYCPQFRFIKTGLSRYADVVYFFTIDPMESPPQYATTVNLAGIIAVVSYDKNSTCAYFQRFADSLQPGFVFGGEVNDTSGNYGMVTGFLPFYSGTFAEFVNRSAVVVGGTLVQQGPCDTGLFRNLSGYINGTIEHSPEVAGLPSAVARVSVINGIMVSGVSPGVLDRMQLVPDGNSVYIGNTFSALRDVFGHKLSQCDIDALVAMFGTNARLHDVQTAYATCNVSYPITPAPTTPVPTTPLPTTPVPTTPAPTTAAPTTHAPTTATPTTAAPTTHAPTTAAPTTHAPTTATPTTHAPTTATPTTHAPTTAHPTTPSPNGGSSSSDSGSGSGSGSGSSGEAPERGVRQLVAYLPGAGSPEAHAKVIAQTHTVYALSLTATAVLAGVLFLVPHLL